jgi:hypothetical protein
LIGCDTSSIYTYNLYMYQSATNQWLLFTNSSYYFTTGESYKDLTILKKLFSDFSSQIIWKIELIVYNEQASNIQTNETYQGSTSMKIYVNFSPLPGVCNVSPNEGNTTSLFYIVCNSWTDPDGSVTNYAFYGKRI